jgi:hypothetical protein
VLEPACSRGDLQGRDGAQSSKGVRTRHPPFFRAPVQARRRSLRNSGELAFTPVKLYIFKGAAACRRRGRLWRLDRAGTTMTDSISPTAAAAISGSLVHGGGEVKGAAAMVARSPTPMAGVSRLVGQQRTSLELCPAPIKCCMLKVPRAGVAAGCGDMVLFPEPIKAPIKCCMLKGPRAGVAAGCGDMVLFPEPIKCCAVCGEGVKRISQGIFCSHLDCPRSVWAHRHCLGKAAGRPTKADLARQPIILTSFP